MADKSNICVTNNQTIALGAVALLAYSLFRKASALGTLNFFPASVKDIKFDGPTPVMTLGLAAQNTSNQSFLFQSIAGNVYANNYLVGTIGSFTPQNIPPNSQKTLLIQARLSLLGVVNDIIKAWTTNNFSQIIELECYANVDGLQVPINIKYKIGK